MLIEKSILLLNEFAETKDDKDFKEFARNLSYFALRYQKEHNINDLETFVKLVEQNTDTKDKEQSKNAIHSISLAYDTYHNGFVDYEKLYMRYKQHDVNDNLLEDSNKQNENEENNEILESLQDLAILSENAKNKQEEIRKLQELKETDDFFMPKDNKKDSPQSHQPSVEAMLNFIQDSKQNYFPFAKEETIGNRKFIANFNKEIKKKSTQELQKLLDSIKAKNEALRKEIEELDETKINLINEVKKELIDNSKLTKLNEMNNQQAEQELTQSPNNTQTAKTQEKDSGDEYLKSQFAKAQQNQNKIYRKKQ